MMPPSPDPFLPPEDPPLLSRAPEADPWPPRRAAGLLLLLLTLLPLPASPWILWATRIILAHVLIGVWVFVRHLRALSPLQQHMDAFAGLLIAGAILSMSAPAVWAAFFAGAFAVALLKYRTCRHDCPPHPYTGYIRLKLRLETPAVPLFALAALLHLHLPQFAEAIDITLFAASLLFALYLILLRRAYPPRPD